MDPKRSYDGIDHLSRGLAYDLLRYCLKNCPLVRPFWEEHRTSEHLSMSLSADQIIILTHHAEIIRDDEELKYFYRTRAPMFAQCLSLECKNEDFADYEAPYLDMRFAGLSDVEDDLGELSETLLKDLNHWLKHECGCHFAILSGFYNSFYKRYEPPPAAPECANE
jgi:hypothetical protein